MSKNIERKINKLREELNHRLDDGEEGDAILQWLNARPEVQSLPVRDNECRTVNKQNLSDWRNGDFKRWQAQQDLLAHARELSADSRQIAEAAEGQLTDHLASVLTARYAALLSDWDGEVTDEFRRKQKALRILSQDIVELRRGDHSAARLKIEQDQLKEMQEWSEAELVELFKKWVTRLEVREWVCGKCNDPAERERRLRAILGLPEPDAGGKKPTPVKVGQG